MRILNKFIKRKNTINNYKYPTKNGITFIHHNPSHGNIGDFLCSPRHYFNLKPILSDLYIIGGGVFKDFAMKQLQENSISSKKAIIWGTGQSRSDLSNPHGIIDELPFLAWGLRDQKIISLYENFLPCCSCLHYMLDSAGNEQGTLLFLNIDPKVTTPEAQKRCQELAVRKGWSLLYNSCQEDEFISNLNRHRHIITNSYHGSYWGLLSGRKVTMMGYSSKFFYLLNNFDISPKKLISINRGETDSLIDAIEKINDEDTSIFLESHKEFLERYRKINIDFAYKLLNKKIISEFNFTDRVSKTVKK